MGLRGAICAALVAAWPLAGAAQPAPASLEACLTPRAQDLARVEADLTQSGWAPVPGAGFDAAVAALTDAFLPLFGDEDKPEDYHETPEETQARRVSTLAWWQERAFAGRVLSHPRGDVLFLYAGMDDDGQRRVECWSATRDHALAEGLIAGAPPAGAQPTPEDSLIVVFGPTRMEGDAGDFTLVVTRQIAPPGVELAASHGLLTTTVFPPVE